MAGELREVGATGQAVYGHVFNNASRRWNGTSFEAFVSGNYNLYNAAMTEQGTSGVYVGDFPIAITTGGHYEIIYYAQQGASPAEGDPVMGTGSVDWDGDAVVVDDEDTVAGEVAGSDWLTYVLRTFKRTDKNTELFEATNAAIAEIRRKFTTQRDEKETTFTDTISVLGDFRLDIEEDLGLMVADVYIQHTNDGYYLQPISKQEYDRKYSIWGTSQSDRGRPRDYCLFGGQIWLGPVPDRTDYTYKTSYGVANVSPVTALSTSIPYTTQDYKEILLHGTLWRLYALVENDDQAGKYRAFWDDELDQMKTRERRNRRLITQTAYQDC